MFKLGKIEIPNVPVILAPMEDVTEPPFRQLCKNYAADIMFTEFISSDGLIRDAKKSMQKLDFEEMERPIGIQIFGNNVDSMVQAALHAEKVYPDIIDINYGCSVRKIASKGGGSGILKDIPKMIKMTKAVVDAVKLPVTVKTRLGYDEQHKEIVEIAERLQDVGTEAITIHGRARTTPWGKPADWTLIGEVKNNPRMHIPVIGNGDILTAEDAKEKIIKFGVDGIMIGRGAIGNPWIFREVKHFLETGEKLPSPTIRERVNICRRHLEKSIAWKGEKKAIFEMRSQYGKYFKGYKNIKPYRMKLVTLTSLNEINTVLDQVLDIYS